MLAFPSETSPIIPGFSGAGDKIPALAQDASRPGFCLSNKPTSKPARASSNAIAPPIRPPPAIATSNVFMAQFYSSRVLRGCDGRTLERRGQVLRKYLCFLSQIPRASPIPFAARLPRLSDETHDFREHVRLCRRKFFASRYSQIVFREA